MLRNAMLTVSSALVLLALGVSALAASSIVEPQAEATVSKAGHHTYGVK